MYILALVLTIGALVSTTGDMDNTIIGDLEIDGVTQVLIHSGVRLSMVVGDTTRLTVFMVMVLIIHITTMDMVAISMEETHLLTTQEDEVAPIIEDQIY